MNFTLVKDISEINIDKNTWNSLASQNQTNTIFQTYEWFHSWWEAFGDEYQLIFIIVKDEGHLKGFAPLMIQANTTGKKTLRFSSDLNADYCDFVIKGNKLEFIDKIIPWLLKSDIEFDNIHLINIPDESTTKSCIETCCLNYNIPLRLQHPRDTPTLLIKGHEDEALRTINKYSVRRHYNKLHKIGTVEFRHINVTDIINSQKSLDHFFKQHISRYTLKNDNSLFERQKNKNFYANLIHNMADTNWIFFTSLEFNGEPIAYHFGFDYNNTIIWYKPSFSIEHKHYSPGSVQLNYLINYAIETKRNEFDFTIGKEAFKKRFSNHTRKNDSIWIDKLKKDFYFQSVKKGIITAGKKVLRLS